MFGSAFTAASNCALASAYFCELKRMTPWLKDASAPPPDATVVYFDAFALASAARSNFFCEL